MNDQQRKAMFAKKTSAPKTRRTQLSAAVMSRINVNPVPSQAMYGPNRRIVERQWGFTCICNEASIAATQAEAVEQAAQHLRDKRLKGHTTAVHVRDTIEILPTPEKKQSLGAGTAYSATRGPYAGTKTSRDVEAMSQDLAREFPDLDVHPVYGAVMVSDGFEQRTGLNLADGRRMAREARRSQASPVPALDW